jgi:methylenetetrahydrofolate--tRNA-(uracil-5-)-methyltransferase
LAVDREAFAQELTEKIHADKNIHVISQRVDKLEHGPDVINIVCTGPLTDSGLMASLKEELGEDFCSFFDAAAPLVYFSSLDTSKMYFKSRYDKGEGKYLNVPLTREEYERFSDELVKGEKVILHDFEHFEGCLPVETMAIRGKDTLRFGPLKPKGLEHDGLQPYAVVQLRQDDAAGDLYGLVGFQTNLTYKEQKRIFSSLPGFANVKFARFGLMHQNSYINAPLLINRDLSLKKFPDTFVAGQFSGVEGYMESASTGLLAGYYALMRIQGKAVSYIPLFSMLGSLVNYIVMSSPKHFAPMNACYGILQLAYKDNKENIYNNSVEEVYRWGKRNRLK